MSLTFCPLFVISMFSGFRFVDDLFAVDISQRIAYLTMILNPNLRLIAFG